MRRHPTPGQRVVVVGTTGSGKTTMAARLAAMHGCRHIELDALHWEPNWTEAPLGVFRHRVEQALECDRWVVDGNYSEVRDIVWGRADTVVWLDYALPVILGRLARRTVQRVLTQEELWNGNRERFWDQFLSRESLFLYALQTYRSRRRTYSALAQRPEYAHLEMIRLQAPRAAAEWLRECDNVTAQLHSAVALPRPRRGKAGVLRAAKPLSTPPFFLLSGRGHCSGEQPEQLRDHSDRSSERRLAGAKRERAG